MVLVCMRQQVMVLLCSSPILPVEVPVPHCPPLHFPSIWFWEVNVLRIQLKRSERTVRLPLMLPGNKGVFGKTFRDNPLDFTRRRGGQEGASDKFSHPQRLTVVVCPRERRFLPLSPSSVCTVTFEARMKRLTRFSF